MAGDAQRADRIGRPYGTQSESAEEQDLDHPDESPQSAAESLAAEIRRRRIKAGLSQRDLARLSGYTRQYVSMAERPGNIPSSEIVRTLDSTLKADGALIAMRAAARAEQQNLRREHQTLLDQSATSERSDVERRAFIGAMTGLAVSLPTFRISDGQRVGAEDIRQILSRTARLRRLDNLLGGADTYRVYSSELATTKRLLKEANFTEPIRRMCTAVVAEQAQLAGWAAFDAGMQHEAKQHYVASFEAAKEARDTALAGNALAFLAYQEVSVRMPDTEMATASFATAQADATPKVKALLLERMAWTHAVAGQANHADRALKMAEEALQVDDDRPEPDWVFWVDADEIRIMAGRCWTELKRPLRAVPILEDSLGRYDDIHARDKSMYLTWLAHSYVDAGEVEQSANVLQRAISLASGVGSARPAERIRGVMRRLQNHRGLSEVATAFDAASALPQSGATVSRSHVR